ncbi:hypothetical protein [Nocardia sp. NPDC057030]|uniref:hypothetical protein n=1 Tax=unclassified Nocardia TaxID=2637762 RepID=UPI0036295DDC
MRLGKTPARINATQLKLTDYWDHTVVSAHIPAEFGTDALGMEWGMHGNDVRATSVWAGAAHETRWWAQESGTSVTISTDNTLSDYATVTGFQDLGTDLQTAASYRRRVGILDADGNRHRIGGYVALTPGDPDQLAAAVYVFGAAGVGLRLPEYALADAEAGRVWDLRQGIPDIAGGQYVPAVGRSSEGNFYVITWGRIQPMSEGFYRRYCDEALVYFSTDFLRAGVSPPGFDRARLLTDLEAFTRR